MQKETSNKRLTQLRYVTLAILLVMFFSIALQKKLGTPYRINNFVSLHIMTPLDGVGLCTLLGECSNDEIYYDQTQASGIAFKSIEGKTYILTADHFCEDHKKDKLILARGEIEFGSTLTVENYVGNAWNAKVLVREYESDLCLVVSEEMPDVRSINLATNMPRMGDDIFTVSEPLGIGPDGTALHFTGKFSGCDSSNICYYSIPATFGSSGSIILNERGEMIGMIQRAIITLQVMSIGVGIDDIKRFLQNASEIIGEDLL